MLRAFSCLYLALMGNLAQAASVVFLNPGYSDERFWVNYTAFMQDAAGDLGMRLDVLYGERDARNIVSLAREVLQRRDKPDYLLFSNEQYVAPELLRMFDGSGIRLFAVHNTLTEKQQQMVGGPRERYGNWIGSLVANDEEAGYLMAKALLALAGRDDELIAFSGVKNTPAAILRELGLQRALRESPQVRLRQLLYGEWKQQRAYEQALALLPRYPGVRLVWAANDEMTFGAMQAAREQGRRLHYTALNNSKEALQARIDGRIDVLATGHFILGACAMVMLHDYAVGLDFAKRGGREQMAHLLRLVDAGQARLLLARLTQRDAGLDFHRFSAQRDPSMKHYACSIDSLLQ